MENILTRYKYDKENKMLDTILRSCETLLSSDFRGVRRLVPPLLQRVEEAFKLKKKINREPALRILSQMIALPQNFLGSEGTTEARQSVLLKDR